METKQMTVKEILIDVINKLGNIRIPTSEVESIGIPVAQAINGIKMCVDAFTEAEKQEEPEIELVEMGDGNA